jgi:hypothetical protein
MDGVLGDAIDNCPFATGFIDSQLGRADERPVIGLKLPTQVFRYDTVVEFTDKVQAYAKQVRHTGSSWNKTSPEPKCITYHNLNANKIAKNHNFNLKDLRG